MSNIKPTFSIDEYDYEGDISESGIYLHFDHTRIRICDANNVAFEEFVSHITAMQKEISEHWLLNKNG